ncbi:MAG: hypothetical protein AAGK78_05030 [Planctomycetota bacterium]
MADGSDSSSEPTEQRLTPLQGFLRNATRVVIFLVVVGLIIFIWEDGLEDRVTAKNIGLVEPGIYRSGQISPHMIGPTLQQLGIDTIISLSYDNPERWENMAEYRTAKTMGVERFHVRLSGDGTGAPREYVQALAYLHDARQDDKTVLVHCWAGSERTSGFVALYRTLFHDGDPEAVVREMARYKHEADADSPLIKYLNENIGEIAEGLVARGLLAEAPSPLPQFKPLWD